MHGGDIYGQKADMDFSVCLNPLGMPPAAAEAAVRGITAGACYPDILCRDLKAALADRLSSFGVPVTRDRILMGNGACELIYLLVQAVRDERLAAGKPCRVLVPKPGFGEYEAAARAYGCEVSCITLKEEGGFSWPALTEETIPDDTGLIFLCSPNNPTGTVPGPGMILKTAELCGQLGIRLCVDECFLPFSCREKELTAIPYTGQYRSLTVLRAFTKIYAMAGLRLGYLLTGSRAETEQLRRRMQPWNVSVPAQMAGLAALEAGEAYLDETRRITEQEKQRLGKALAEAGAEIISGSEGNFLLFRAPRSFYREMLGQGILIRRFEPSEGLPEDVFRTGIRSPEENDAFIRILKETVYGTRNHDPGNHVGSREEPPHSRPLQDLS